MALEIRENHLRGDCPICDGSVPGPPDVEESEILFCPDCQSMLVVESTSGGRLALGEAPEMEEDWGE